MSKRDRAFDIPAHLQRSPRTVSEPRKRSVSGTIDTTNIAGTASAVAPSVASSAVASKAKHVVPAANDAIELQLARGAASAVLLAVIDARSVALRERQEAEVAGDYDAVIRAAEKELNLKLAMGELTRALRPSTASS